MTVLAGRYELLERVGEGGMSVVWRARDRRLERHVAVKQLRAFVAEGSEQAQRFRREAHTLAALAHEHIVRLYDYVATGSESFLVMEYVEGGNLAQTTRGRLPLQAADAAAYARPVAEALAYAHAQGVVHRDLTPSNILVERESGRVVTTDFGLARIVRSAGSLTATGVLLGTPEYWSPELALGRETEPPADLYALGCVLFLLLSGRLPFEGEDRLALGLRRAHEDAPSLRTRVPDTSGSLVALVDSLLAREPTARPDAATAARALGELELGANVRAGDTESRPEGAGAPATIAFESERPTTALPSPLPPRSSEAPASPVDLSRRRARRRVLGALVASAIVIVAALLASRLQHPSTRVPNVVALRENAARAQILHSLPSATVTVQRVYSTRVAAGRVIRQRPRPPARISDGSNVRLVVSRGTPFARVPQLTDSPAASAKASLARDGFASRYTYVPSWTIRKGSVVELQPATGTELRRPASVTIVVASGYPRSVVPDVLESGVGAAEEQLGVRHLRVRLVYRLDESVPPGQVLGQLPTAGTSVYQGTQVRLVVARGPRWVKIFDASGTAQYESDPFTVPARWRIRYRLTPNPLGLAFARLDWFAEGDSFGSDGFLAGGSNSLLTYIPSDGAGEYRLTVDPYAGTHWFVQVEALE